MAGIVAAVCYLAAVVIFLGQIGLWLYAGGWLPVSVLFLVQLVTGSEWSTTTAPVPWQGLKRLLDSIPLSAALLGVGLIASVAQDKDDAKAAEAMRALRQREQPAD